MKKRLSIMLISLLCISTFACALTPIPVNAASVRQNTYPIIFVHGLAGFDDVLGIPYWGGTYNISKDLNARGYENYVTAVGPFSSNWDRACELYAEIKGGTVDYGKAHSEKYGHARYGRTYPGFYTQWGETNTSGQVKKVHLIGHSMGGQTVRTLVQLLENGSPEEIAANSGDISPLFDGKKKVWVDGVLTVATPHDGSTATYALVGKGKNSLLQQSILFLSTISGGSILNVYDFYLDQWGLTRQPGESCDSFISRVENSSAWQTSRDLSNWDLKPDGAMELNTWVKAQPDVYYFSQATSCTYKDLITGHQLPRLEMNPLFWVFSAHIGAYTQTSPFPLNKSWWENDGLVSVTNADGPHLGSSDEIVTYNGTPQIGKWNYLGKLNKTDHTGVVGILSLKDQRPLFRSYTELLGSLPQ